MEFKTKFELGQRVWGLSRQSKNTFAECQSCVYGKIRLRDNKELPCPTCNGSGLLTTGTRNYWTVGLSKLTVGQFQIIFPASEHHPKDRERVMCHETGVGSGTLHSVDDLYESMELAQVECDRRNNLDPEEDWLCVACNGEYERVKHSDHSRTRNCPVHGNTYHVERKAADDHLQKIQERKDHG